MPWTLRLGNITSKEYNECCSPVPAVPELREPDLGAEILQWLGPAGAAGPGAGRRPGRARGQGRPHQVRLDQGHPH